MDGKEKDLGFMAMNALAVLLNGASGSSAGTIRYLYLVLSLLVL